MLSFRCRVGHAYSLETLVPLKEEQLEQALWSTIEVYEEVAMLHRALAERAARAEVRVRLERRAETATAIAQKIRNLIETDQAVFDEGAMQTP